MINVSKNKIRKIHNFWNNVHFHPTDAIEDDWGQKILDRIAGDGVAKTVRLYAMLEDIVTCDESGQLHYDYTNNDIRLDYLVGKGFTPLIDFVYMPPFLAVDSITTSCQSKNKTRYKGKLILPSPPKDYAVWEEICYDYVKHIVERYGLDVVSQWRLMCWNEPDSGSFFLPQLDNHDPALHTRATEYIKLYTGFSNAVQKVSPQLKCGGPSVSFAWTTLFINEFLTAVKRDNLKLDFVSVHTYGVWPPMLTSGEVHLDAHNTLKTTQMYIDIVDKYLGKDTEIICDEWGAASLGFANVEEYPKLMFREGSEYATYFGKMITYYVNAKVDKRLADMLICLSGQHEMTVDFSGFRNFFTLHGFAKPIYNAFVLAKKLGDTQLHCTTDVDNLAILPTMQDENYSVLLSYGDEHYEKPLTDVADTLVIDGAKGDYDVTIWLIDEKHTNPYKTLLANGWNQTQLTDEQIELLRSVGDIKPLATYRITCNGKAQIPVAFTTNALCLVQLNKCR